MFVDEGQGFMRRSCVKRKKQKDATQIAERLTADLYDSALMAQTAKWFGLLFFYLRYHTFTKISRPIN